MAPWVPTRRKDFSRIDKLAKLKEGDNFVDVGCGTGSLLVYLAKKYPQTNFVGIEIAWPLFLITYSKKIFFGCQNIELKNRDFFKCDFSDYNKFFVYGLTRKAFSRLSQKIKKECDSGTKIISYTFSIADLNLIKKEKSGNNGVPINLYAI